MRKLVLLFACVITFAMPTLALQASTDKPVKPTRAELLVLGTYHMANIQWVQLGDVTAALGGVEFFFFLSATNPI
jgi:hypothetical protein